MNHTELLNYLVEKHNLKSYLELGVQNPANNFNKIRCEFKIGVDPETNDYRVQKITSDDYFRYVSGIMNFKNGKLYEKYDLIFIDGLHHADQVKRDFENSLRCLNDGGYIVIHDCLPEDEITTCVPRGNQKMWHGDVYKFVMKLEGYAGIDFITYNFDNGCCVVWKDASKKAQFTMSSYTWQDYINQGHQLMNVQNEPVRI